VADDFQQVALRFSDPIQHDDEVIRDIMLADATVAERSCATGLDRATVGEKARRFLEGGMRGLVDRRTTTDKGQHDYPVVVASYILYLKQLYPPIHHREIARIVGRKFGYKTNHHRVQRVLARHPIPVQLPLPVTGYHQFDDAYRARWTVVRLYDEGWRQTSIAGVLKLSRPHVWHILRAFERDGFAGLEDQRTRPSTHPATQLSLPFLKEVLDVQRAHPRAGRFRVRGLVAKRTGRAPSETTIGRAMALNRRAHGAPPAWATDRPDPAAPDGIIKEMPFEPTRRHRYWFLDYRYLVRVGDDDHWVYSLCVIEGYSRKILAGMATEYQDTIAVLQLLSAALSEYGQPEGMVSDNGSVFTSDAYEGLLNGLGIAVCHIEKGKPWQDLIEIVFTQLTKRGVLPRWPRRDHIADLDLPLGDDDAIDQQFHELAPLNKSEVLQRRLHASAKVGDAGAETCQIAVLLRLCVDLTHLLLQALSCLHERLMRPLEFVATDDRSQVHLQQAGFLSLHLSAGVGERAAPHLEGVRQPRAALRAGKGLRDQGGSRDNLTHILPHDGVKRVSRDIGLATTKPGKSPLSGTSITASRANVGS